MDSESFPTFSVEFKRDWDGRSAGRQYFAGRLEFFPHPGSGLNAFRIFDEKKQRFADQTLLQDIKLVSSHPPPTGTTTTLLLRDHNLYLKFESKDEMKRFFAMLKKMIIPGNNNQAAVPVLSGALAPRPAQLDKNDCRKESVTESHINGFAEPENEIAKVNDGMVDTKISFLAGMAVDERSENKNPAPRKLSTMYVRPLHRPVALDVKASVPIRVDKENQHRTPVKNSNQNEAAEKRAPLAPKCEPSPDDPSSSKSSNNVRANGLRMRPVTPESRNATVQTIPQRGGAHLSLKRPSIMDPIINEKPKRSKSNDHDGNSIWSPRPSALAEKPQLKGFANMGNTCYMNSILQALFSLDPFAKELHRCFKVFNEYIPAEWLFYSLPTLLGVKDHDNQDFKTELLRNVKKAISSTAKRFMGNLQHDAHEFLAQVLDQLKEEINQLSRSCILPASPENPIQSNFEFSVVHSIECQNCHHVSQNEEIYMDLSLDLPLSRRNTELPLPLQPLLGAYFNDEAIEHKCEKCESNSAVISHKFKRLPRILTLHLKRYTFTNAAAGDAKLATKVAFPRYLSLHRLCVENIENAPLLSESTKKHVVAPPTPMLESTSHRTDNGEKARRQLFDDEDKRDSLEDETKQSTFQQRTYFTRAAAKGTSVSYVGMDEESALDEVLERSKYETGPPADYPPEESEYERQVEEATRLSLLEASGCSADFEPLLDTSGAQISENFFEEDMDGEMRDNADDGHLQHSFRLFGVVNHIGTGTESGHYVSDVFDLASAGWRSYNDSQVAETTEEIVRQGRQQAAYIFFYVSKAILDDVKGAGSSSS